MSIADFLTHQNLRMVLARRIAAAPAGSGKRSAGEAGAAAAAEAQPLPVGNHGEIFAKGSAV